MLKRIEGAKQSWALENHKSSSSVPVDSDLFGETRYIRRKPICPLGGKYTLGRVDEYARCTVPEHNLDFRLVKVVDQDSTPIERAHVAIESEPYETSQFGMAYAPEHSVIGRWLIVSKAGYQTERLIFPKSWPVTVTLKRSTDSGEPKSGVEH